MSLEATMVSSFNIVCNFQLPFDFKEPLLAPGLLLYQMYSCLVCIAGIRYKLEDIAIFWCGSCGHPGWLYGAGPVYSSPIELSKGS